MIDRPLLAFWNRVNRAAAVPDESLRAYRWILGIYLLLFDAPYSSWIDRTPDAFFNPPVFSLAYLVGSFPPAPFFTILDIVAIVALCTMTIGYKAVASTAVVLVTRLVGTTFAYSTGKISHQIMLSVLLLCMLVARWGEGAPRDEPIVTPAPNNRVSRRTAQGMSLLAVMTVFGFFTAGWEKVRNWVNLDTGSSGFLDWYYPRSYDYDLFLLAGWVPGLPPELLKAADIAASLFEVVGIVALLWGAVMWRTWLAVAVVFHLMNTLVLNITFPTQAIIYLAFVSLAFIDQSRLARYARPATYVVIAVGAWHVWTRIRETGSPYFLWDGTHSTVRYDAYVSIVVYAIVLTLLVYDIVTRRRAASRPLPETDPVAPAPVG